MIRYGQQKHSILVTREGLISYQGNAILEIRAGTGGSEAQLFVKEIFDMYYEYPQILCLYNAFDLIKYAIKQKWRFQIISTQHTECGGFREAIAEVFPRYFIISPHCSK
jgi:peptide chain release factor 1